MLSRWVNIFLCFGPILLESENESIRILRNVWNYSCKETA